MSPGDFTGKHHELQIFIELAMDRGPSAPLPSQAPGDSQGHPTSTAVVFRRSWSQSLAAEAVPNPWPSGVRKHGGLLPTPGTKWADVNQTKAGEIIFKRWIPEVKSMNELRFYSEGMQTWIQSTNAFRTKRRDPSITFYQFHVFVPDQQYCITFPTWPEEPIQGNNNLGMILNITFQWNI